MIIEQNDEITLSEKNGRVFIAITNDGYNLKKFDELTRKHTRLKVSNFLALKKALEHKSHDPIEIGSWIESMELEISADKMEALLTIFESQTYIQENLAEIHTNIQKNLHEQRIIYGNIPIDLLSVKSGKTYIVAKGLPPQKGENAKVTYLDQAEKKPVVKEDGNTDFFDMNFIVEIKEGSWIGKKYPLKKV